MKIALRALLAAALLGGGVAVVRATAQQQQQPTPVDIQEELREFVPSEKIPADSAVSFPSDI